MNSQPQQNPYFATPTAKVEPDEENGSAKRKSDEIDSPQTQQRSKRNRYISIACNECKRRKIKCNGQNPCQRCGNLRLECIYAPNCCSSSFKDSEEFKAMSAHLQSLQQQVNDLYSHLGALRGGPPQFPMHPSLVQPEPEASYRQNTSPTQSRASHPQYQGPTSAAFNLDVAKSSLQTMGITQPEIPDDAGATDIDPALDGRLADRAAPVAAMVGGSNQDAVWQLSKDDAVKLCRIYDEEMGMMYPMLDINQIIRHVGIFFSQRGLSEAEFLNSDASKSANLDASDVKILKMVLASALMAENGGQSPLGTAIYESCRDAFEGKLTGPVEIKGLILLVVVAEYHFQEDEEPKAYRIIGLATRLCLEMGLHRRDNLIKLFADEEERSWAIKLFWSIYVLDRRWSFGTGIPFALQDADIDPALPEPDAAAPYLTAMVSYSRISSKIWRSTNSFDGSPHEINQEDMAFLDYQILQWHNTIPASLRFDPSEDYKPPKGVSRGQRRLHIILYLRTNQMRTVIYRPILHSATTIIENRRFAQIGVDVAKDTIRVLSRLHDTTDIYDTQQVCFNYFLLSALAVIFLAVSHAPVEFSHQVRDEFYQALDIVKGFSHNSYVSKRLWQAIRGLREIGPKLGLVNEKPSQTPSTDEDAHSSAAVAMAGLAGHQVDGSTAYASLQSGPVLSDRTPVNGQQMSNELTNLFEAAKDYGSALPNATDALHVPVSNAYVGPQSEKQQHVEGLSGIYGSGGEFSKIMGGLF